jgi:hypothetical protein
MHNISLIETIPNWKSAWQNTIFRKKIYIGLIMLLIILISFPVFFQYIEKRPGTTLNDLLLNKIPPSNVSIIIFISIWATFLLTIIRSFKHPDFFITILYAYCLLCIFRFISITFVPLDAPVGLIPLLDPISNSFYGKTFVTKDLFFSGHTSTLFLMYFSFQQRLDKYFSLSTACLVGVLVLIQHVHYTIDVLAAPIFAYISLIITKKRILSSPNKFVNQ